MSEYTRIRRADPRERTQEDLVRIALHDMVGSVGRLLAAMMVHQRGDAWPRPDQARWERIIGNTQWVRKAHAKAFPLVCVTEGADPIAPDDIFTRGELDKWAKAAGYVMEDQIE